jgi:spore coat polysaccharide biosynthesis predicted glycosyltransferase SpsG
MAVRPELPQLVVRADADLLRGAARVLRGLALVHAWQAAGGHATFISRCENSGLRARIEASGAALVALRASDCGDGAIAVTRDQLGSYQSAVLVLDGEELAAEQQQMLRVSGHPVMVVEQNPGRHSVHADILLNPNFGASAAIRADGAGTTVLAGGAYAMLRPEFAVWRRRFRSIRTVARKVLVTMGGSDPENITQRVIEALTRLGAPGLETKVVAGPANPHVKTLEKVIASSKLPIQLLIDVPDMAALMGWADLAVSDVGSTCWELACLGVPAIVLAATQQQLRIAGDIESSGIAQNMGWHAAVPVDRLAAALDVLLYSSFRRLRMSQQGRALVDGKGAERVMNVLCKHSCPRAA